MPYLQKQYSVVEDSQESQDKNKFAIPNQMKVGKEPITWRLIGSVIKLRRLKFKQIHEKK